MKTGLLNLFMICVVAITIVSCKDKAAEANTSEAEAATVAESTSEKYTVNIAESMITWKGFKPTGSHNGTVNIENGNIALVDGQLHSGTFSIDMNSIVSLDMEEGEYKTSLENHLKGTVEGKEGDFFNVTKFPKGTFEITGSEALEDGKTRLSGNLDLKGQKHNISFPVKVTTQGDIMTITSDAFTIDRTTWGINYKSKTIFDNLGDKFINDDMEMSISLKAKKN